jgi:hypothetical protein
LALTSEVLALAEAWQTLTSFISSDPDMGNVF